MDEMIEVGQQVLNIESNNDALNDVSSGLYNMSFSIGEIFGPLIGNLLYTETSFTFTCDTFGSLGIIFGLAYFV